MKGRNGILYALPLLLVGCSTSPDTVLTRPKDFVSVSIHGVNYSADAFRYFVVDPKEPKNSGGGEFIEPFGAGGIMCCYSLPKQWRPGIQILVRSTHWLPKQSNGELPEVREIFTVEVPRYTDGKAGELWVMRTAEGKVEVVSSDLQPNHPQWPGKVKGWPVPSVEYRRERWNLHRKLIEDEVEVFQELLRELSTSKEARTREAWPVDKRRFGEEMTKFSGPDDPAYAEYLERRYSAQLARSRARLQELFKERPGCGPSF
ncbi:DUF3304 domain-containing protein [Massilia sp. DD77]|uniref:DUF3304 domain-containing protein n=1 Tax=Massilia sp. DD77 TaxID=3109349 RepID=UPI00300062CC